MQTTARDPRKICIQIGLSFLVFSLVKWAARVLLTPWFATWPDSPWLEYLSHQIPVYCFGFVALLICMHFVSNGTDERPRAPLSFKRGLTVLLFGFGSSYVVGLPFMAINGVINHTGLAGITTTVNDLNMTGLDSILPSIILGALVAGVGEEYMFRVLIYKKMAGCPDIAYLLMSGILFGVMHDNINQGFAHVVYGIAIAWVYLRTRSYLLVAFLHFLNDALAFTATPLMQNGYLLPALAILGLTAVGGSIVFIYVVIRYTKQFKATLLPGREPGWTYRENQGPVAVLPGSAFSEKAFAHRRGTAYVTLCNIGVILYFVWIGGNMIYNLIPA